MDLTPAGYSARLLTSPLVVPILFSIVLIAMSIAVFTPGFGLPSVIGVSAFGLYFFGHYVSGFAGMETIGLFILVIVLMIIELVIPGFGIFGILGIIALISGIVMAAYSTVFSLISLLVAFGVTVIVLIVAVRY